MEGPFRERRSSKRSCVVVDSEKSRRVDKYVVTEGGNLIIEVLPSPMLKKKDDVETTDLVTCRTPSEDTPTHLLTRILRSVSGVRS